MPNRHFHTAISYPRFSKYLAACSNNKNKALRLYRANILLSQKLYAVIGVFEVILRNSIDRHFEVLKGNDWLAKAVAPEGFLDISPSCEEAFHRIQEGIHLLNINYSHDALIAKLTFGFWTYQFAATGFAASGNTLLAVFPNRPFGVNQKTVFQYLLKINEVRNRIAHYEPICFDKRTGAISSFYTEQRYKLILEVLSWLGCNPKRILYGIDTVQNALNTIKDLTPPTPTAPSPTPSQSPTAP